MNVQISSQPPEYRPQPSEFNFVRTARPERSSGSERPSRRTAPYVPDFAWFGANSPAQPVAEPIATEPRMNTGSTSSVIGPPSAANIHAASELSSLFVQLQNIRQERELTRRPAQPSIADFNAATASSSSNSPQRVAITSTPQPHEVSVPNTPPDQRMTNSPTPSWVQAHDECVICMSVFEPGIDVCAFECTHLM